LLATRGNHTTAQQRIMQSKTTKDLAGLSSEQTQES